MGKGWELEILFFDELPSTQTWLCEKVRTEELSLPLAVVAKRQTQGVGSRGNVWESVPRALTFSVALPLENLPDDLPLLSSSLYFAYSFKEILSHRGSCVRLKWPNDLYLGEKKCGGVITSKIKEVVVVGVGINLESHIPEYAALEESVASEEILEAYLGALEDPRSWKQIFSNYKLDFLLNSDFVFHCGDQVISASGAELCEDGSLCVGGVRVYGAR